MFADHHVIFYEIIIFPELQLYCSHKQEAIKFKFGAIKNNFGLIPNLLKRNIENTEIIRFSFVYFHFRTMNFWMFKK